MRFCSAARLTPVSSLAIFRADAAAELDVLLAREFLVAQEQDAVLEKRAIDVAELLLAHVARRIEVANLGAEAVGQGAQLQSHDASGGGAAKQPSCAA